MKPLSSISPPEEPVPDIEKQLEAELSAHVFFQELIEAGQIMGREPAPDLVRQAGRLFSDCLHPEAEQMVDLHRRLLDCEAQPRPAGALQGTGEDGEIEFRCPTCAADGSELDECQELPLGELCSGCGLLFAGSIPNPQGSTQHHTMRVGGFVIDVWWRSKHPESLSQDQCVVELLPDGRVRVAVIDGVTPAAGLTPTVASAGSSGPGVNGASYAASVVRSELKKGGDLRSSLQAANSRLQGQFGGDGLYSRALPQATAVAFDIFPDGRVEGLRGGTDQAYSISGSSATNLFPGPINDPAAAEAFRRELAEQDATVRRSNPNITQAEIQNQVRFPLEEKHYKRENWWGGAAIGRFSEPNLVEFKGSLEERLVLCSDGAHIDKPEEQHRLFDLKGWMSGGLERLEGAGRATEGHASDKKTDDVTVISLRRA